MKKTKISGFTIFELIVTTVLMAVVMVVAPVVMIKRGVKSKKTNNKTNYIAECSSKCIYMAREGILRTADKKEERKNDYNKNSGELYTIELMGGGGGGNSYSVGYKGQEKTIYLFSLENNQANTYKNLNENQGGGILTGNYLLQVGAGGKAGKSGEPSIICAIKDSDTLKPLSSLSCKGKVEIARAEGGITENVGNGGGINQPGGSGSIVIK